MTKTKHDPAVGCPLERRVMPSDLEGIQVQFFYLSTGEPAFICGAIGHITSGLLEQLEKEVNENPLEDTFARGGGDYLFYAKFQSEQRGEFGRIELNGYWELDLIEFRELSDDGA
jgi:hypothetical protein